MVNDLCLFSWFYAVPSLHPLNIHGMLSVHLLQYFWHETIIIITHPFDEDQFAIFDVGLHSLW